MKSMQEQDIIETKKLERISVWKPWEQARLLWWMCVDPSKVRAYEEQWGAQALSQARNRLSGTLVCAWVFLLTLAAGLGMMPHIEKYLPAPACLAVSGAVLCAWVWDGWRQVRAVRGVVAFAVGVVAYLIMCWLAVVMSGGLASSALVIVAFAVALLIMDANDVLHLGAAAGITGGLASGVKHSVEVVVALRIIMPLQDAISSLMDVDDADMIRGKFMAFLVIFLTMVLVVLVVWYGGHIGKRIKTEHPIGVGYLVLAAVLVAYVLLTSHCLLGG